jgi:nucleotidyltransferase/DNA polymerase involved in DNA repair
LTISLIFQIPGIGWSYDAKLRDMKIDTIGDLQKLSLTELEDKFGARVGSMIYNCCRGNDTSLVEDKGPPKSLSVEDSFRACLNLKQAEVGVGWTSVGACINLRLFLTLPARAKTPSSMKDKARPAAVCQRLFSGVHELKQAGVRVGTIFHLPG